MEKSLLTPEHRIFTALLREMRKGAAMTQVELASKLETTQSIISKWERGELRLDFIQMQSVCHALGITLASFAQEFERRVNSSRRGKSRKK